MPGMPTERAAQRIGLSYFREIYADRTYDDNFNLTDRSKPGAVLHDPTAATQPVMRMLEADAVISVSGKKLPVAIDLICLHGDSPNAVAAARTLRTTLEAAGITLRVIGNASFTGRPGRRYFERQAMTLTASALRELREGQKISYELVQDKRSGKTSADYLRVE